MASATAFKKEPASKAPQANSGKQSGKEVKRPLVSRPVGIGVMAVLLCLSLFAGNFRALSKVSPKSFLRQGEVASIVENRVNAAKNAETVAKRAGLDSTLYSAVDDAVRAVQIAKTARALSRADQNLMSAVGDMTGSAQDALTDVDQKNLTGAMDTFNDEGNLLRFEARSFNEAAQKALNLYEKLPLRALLAQPDYYEGI